MIMHSGFSDIVSPRNLRRSPVRESGINMQLQNPGQSSESSSRTKPPSRIKPLSGIRPPTGMRPSSSQLQLPPSSVHIPRTAGTIPRPQKVIPLPGAPNKLAAVPKPIRVQDSTISNLLPLSAVNVPSLTLLPKPSFMQHVTQPETAGDKYAAIPASRLGPPSRLQPPIPGFDSKRLKIPEEELSAMPTSRLAPPSRLPPPITKAGSQRERNRSPNIPVKRSSSQAPKTPKISTSTAINLSLPRTAVKTRVMNSDPSSEIYHIAGRDIEFVDWVPSPEFPEARQTERKSVIRPGKAQIVKGITSSKISHPIVPKRHRSPKPKKVYEFDDELSVTAAKQFAIQLDADLAKVQKMNQEMQELKQRGSSILHKIKNMYAKEGLTERRTASLDVEEFREKYGITQSPKMRQLLEVTRAFNQDMIKKNDVLQKMITDPREQISFPEIAAQHVQQQLTRQEKIDNYKQKIDIQQEYRNMLEERKRKHTAQKPLVRQEQEEIRRCHTDTQVNKYTAPTEEELDKPQELAEMMELQEAGILLTDTPHKTVEVLFSEATPRADISYAVGNLVIPNEIALEEMNTINSLDLCTAEVALNANSVIAPAHDIAKSLLENSLQEMTAQSIHPVPQPLDPLYAIDLKLDRPKRQNLVQLQGSSQPFWFPGFYTFFPGPPGLVQATKSPSATLLMALRKIQPSVII
ncbi:uncharacterized protein LOC129722015 [Wyeomyia smithii]|uniref:uncharacterized protein LOC129722015 n=1 Tax=Wyeomyia smithii TaxID=174621 RepID=UPI0024680ED3|nr:uncharacterized protein LOC129722015 [Wyeomyia smithii]